MNNKKKIEKEIFENPTYRFHIRELARKIKLNPNTIINLSADLKKQGIIKKEKIKSRVEIYADIENKEFLRKKRFFNLEQMYESNLVDFLINYYSNPSGIIVMGSYSRGEDIEKSDIDLVVITDNSKIPNLEKYEKILKRKIHLLIVDYKKISKEFHQNMINGITLHGFLK